MKLTKPEHIGALQLIPGVRRTVAGGDMASVARRRAGSGLFLACLGMLVVCGAAAYAASPAENHSREVASLTEELGFPAEYDEAPQAQRITRPKYPKRAFEACIEGTVVVLIGIDADGAVAATRIAESIKGLDDAALACVNEWRFRPAKKAGVAVGSVALAPVAFKIYDHNDPHSPQQCKGKKRMSSR
jgi:TonB family protein